MTFEEFKRLQNQINNNPQIINKSENLANKQQVNNPAELFNNYQKQNWGLLDQFSFKNNKKNHWIVGIILFFIILIIVIVFLLVWLEIQKREKALREIIDKAQQMTVSGKFENNPLIQELINKTTTSEKVVSSNTIPVIEPIIKDKNRELAERNGTSFLGNQSSTLVIVEFVDFDCPVCLQEFPIIRSIINKYQKDLLFIFRNYPVRGNDSIMLAQAALCAEEQGKFWQFHDRLFANQGKIKTTDDVKNLAIMSGLDWNKLNQCVISDKYRQKIIQDTQDALDLGVRGTPTFFINGNKLEGAVSATDWEAIIKKYKELIQ